MGGAHGEVLNSMRREELTELHYITCIDNVPSMLERGLLCHERVRGVDHVSVADPEIQDQQRAPKSIAGRPLHQYVNLYLWARNAMLFRAHLHESSRGLCVLSIRATILDLPGVVVTDRNAAADVARPEFVSGGGLEIIDPSLTFAESWDHPDFFEKLRRKQAAQAEVLVPERVAPSYIRGAYLPSRTGCAELHRLTPELPMRPWPHLFFADKPRGAMYEPESI